MNKELPDIFVKNYNPKDNNKEYYYSNNINLDETKEQIDRFVLMKKINDLFSSVSFVYKTSAKVYLKDEEKIITVIGRKNNHLILFDGSIINIDDILDIEAI